MGKKPVLVYLDVENLKKLDEKRGEIPRSIIIRKLIREYLKDNRNLVIEV